MRRWTRLLLIVVAMGGSRANAQAVITGHVRDTSGRALPGAQVLLEGAGRETRTDSSGKYLMSVAAESYTVQFRHLGYGPLTRRAKLTRGATTVVDAILAPGEVPQLDTLEVRAPRPRGLGREAFEERRALGLGKFIDSTQLRRMEGRRMSDVLRDQGVRVWATKGPVAAYYAANPIKMTINGQPECFMSVILDGVTLYRARSRGATPPDISRDFLILNLEAVEVYRGSAQTPLEFASYDLDCGVLVLWTRRGK